MKLHKVSTENTDQFSLGICLIFQEYSNVIGMIGRKTGHLLKYEELFGKLYHINNSETSLMMIGNIAATLL